MRQRVVKGKWQDVDYHFVEYKNDEFSKKEHLISVSFFFLDGITQNYAKMKCMSLDYMENEYKKKKDSYKKGLDEICQNCNDSNLRIYCDTSSLEVAQKYLEYDFVEVVWYDFPQLRDNYGFFGTLMRYIPLFNFSQFDNRWTTVCVLDLDNSYLRSCCMIDYFKQNEKSNMAFWTRPCYYMSPRMFAIPVEPNCYSIISSFIMQRTQQDKRVFMDFLNDCVIGEDEDYTICRRRYLGEEGGKLEYGVDEYFINAYFLQKCYYDEGKSFNAIMHRDVFGGVLEWLKYMRFMFPKVEIIDEEAVKKFMRECATIFFPKGTKIPDKDGEGMMEWVGETFYETKMNISERREDQLRKMEQLIKVLERSEFDGLNMRQEMVDGLRNNCKIRFGNHAVFLVEANYEYPRYKSRVVKTFKR